MAFTLDVQPAAYINLDLFPAKVLVAPVRDFMPVHEEYRVIITDNRLYIIDDRPEGPEVIVSDAFIKFEGDNKVGYTVTTAEQTWHITRALNCGCGSRLRGLHPFAGVPFISQLKK